MATYFGTSGVEGSSITRPPFFDGSNYNSWKVKMRLFLQSLDYELWYVVEDGPFIPTKTDESGVSLKKKGEFTEGELKKLSLNSKAMHCLVCALSPTEFNRVSTCKSAKEIWDRLLITYEGTDVVKESKLNILTTSYELFKMKENESISEMFTRFTDIINGLAALGKTYQNSEMCRKVLRALPSSWESKKTAIKEAKNLNTLPLDELLGSLMSYEVERESFEQEKKEEKSKKNLALKASLSSSEEESDEDAEFAMLARKFRRFYKKREGSFSKKPITSEKGKKILNKTDNFTCFGCKKPGHMKIDCPLLKKNASTSKDKRKKKAMVATWSDCEISDDEDKDSSDEVANLCLMADVDDEVGSEPSYDIDELKEMVQGFYSKCQKLKIKNVELKKNIDDLSHKNDVLSLENEELKTNVKDLHSTLAKFVDGKEKLDMLLSKQRCVFDKAGIGYNSNSKQKFLKSYFVKPSSSCTKCGRHGHDSLYCKVYFTKTKMVWVPKGSKPQKMIWVPKANPMDPNAKGTNIIY
jgi:cell division protein FtsB/Arc/MetJ-type ribon-helix-helix transcriptional regulator